MIEELAELVDNIPLPEFYDTVLEKTGYAFMYESKPTEENKTRLENVRELKSSIIAYVNNAEIPSLAGFLEEIALYTDIEQYNAGDDAVVMMTMHSAKGLEFPHVFLVGFEDGLFPGMRAIGDREEMEEERRLCYVAITRAKLRLTITHARQRMLYGRTAAGIASRFLSEIPEDMIIRKGGFQRSPEYGYSSVQSQRMPSYRVPEKKQELPLYVSEPKTVHIDLKQGDMVMHTAFGRGMVLTVMKMGNDALLEIAFDQIGTKKLMAKTASQHMKKL
jgi:DNA helicase-2/ATP-dependent DNA helicase PcrA